MENTTNHLQNPKTVLLNGREKTVDTKNNINRDLIKFT